MKPSTLVPTKTDTVMASTFSATRVRVKSEFESAQAACASERHAYFRIYLCAAVPVKISDEHEIHHRRHSRPHRPWEDGAGQGIDRNRRGSPGRREAARHHYRPGLRPYGLARRGWR